METIDLSIKENSERFYKACANWMIGPVKEYLNTNAISIEQFPVTPEMLRDLVEIVEFTDIISFNTAKDKVFPEMINNPLEKPMDIIKRLGLAQNNDASEMKALAIEIVAKFPEKAAEYKGGKTGLLGFFTGEMLRVAGKGKLNPKVVNEVLKEVLQTV